jgi:hypothetical protein
MSPRNWTLCLVCLSIITAVNAPTSEAGKPRIPAPKRPPVTPYMPRVQEYSLVVPADPHDTAHDHAPWEQQRPKAPLYPWGWFGAQSYSQRGTHVRYYGDTYDFNTRRGY